MKLYRLLFCALFIVSLAVVGVAAAAPVMTSSPVTSAYIDEYYVYDVDASDADGDPISYSLTTAPSGMTMNTSTGAISWLPSSTGTVSVTVQASDGNASVAQSYTIVVQERSMLEITDIDVDLDERSDTNLDDGDRIRDEASPGSRVRFDVDVKNMFSRSEDVDINDVSVEITIEGIDSDSDDLNEESDEFDLEAGDKETASIDFRIPDEADDDTYDVVIEARGRDDHGGSHYAKATLRLEVQKQNHDLRVRDSRLDSSTLDCGRNTNLFVKVANYGSDQEDDVRVQVESSPLGIIWSMDGIELDNDLDDSDSTFSKSIPIRVADSVRPGTYAVEVRVYGDGGLEDSESLTLVVRECAPAAPVPSIVGPGGPYEEVVVRRAPYYPTMPGIVAQEVVEQRSFTDSQEYVMLLVVLVVVALALLVVMLSAALRR